MLVDHGGVDVGDLGPLGEAIDDEGVQHVGVRDTNASASHLRRARDRAASPGVPLAICTMEMFSQREATARIGPRSARLQRSRCATLATGMPL